MELKQLQALRVIAQTGSFSSAAAQLHVTQSALSHQIRKLEAELGETLLIRARPKVYPSAAGHTALGSAERIFAEISGMKQLFTPGRPARLVGTLRVAASNLGIVYLYGHLCEEFIRRHPGVELILTATETPLDGVRQVLARTADLAFAPFPLDFPNLETVTLGTAEHVVIAARNHPLARSSAVSIDELKRLPFIRYQPGAGTRQASDQIFLSAGGYPPILTESNDTEFIKRVVGLGLGVALVPLFTVRNEIRTGKLKAVRLRSVKVIQKFGLVHRQGLKMRALEAFKKLCLEKRGLILRQVRGALPARQRTGANGRARR